MRFFFLVAFLAVIAAVFAGDGATCRNRNRDVYEAINRFCGWTYDLVVPSAKAGVGFRTKNSGGFVQITGNCKPGQWVPRDICLKQFWNICAKGKFGTGVRNYGRNDCQKWVAASTKIRK